MLTNDAHDNDTLEGNRQVFQEVEIEDLTREKQDKVKDICVVFFL